MLGRKEKLPTFRCQNSETLMMRVNLLMASERGAWWKGYRSLGTCPVKSILMRGLVI